MVIRRGIFSVFLLTVIADLAFGGQGYEGSQRRPENPGHPSECPPVCAMFCPYGFQSDSQGCSICQCNPRPCPADTVIDQPGIVCNPMSGNGQCRNGAFCNGGPADEPGYCCRRVTQNVHCPKVTSKCWTNQKVDYCTTLSCPDGYKCCKQACGRRCVPAKGKLYGGGGRRRRGTRVA